MLLLCLGSNSQQQTNIEKACDMLSDAFGSLNMSHVLWTDPIGCKGPKYLNRLVATETSLSFREVDDICKAIENQLGRMRKPENKGVVTIDIDILLLNDQRHHIDDWQRPYVQTLLAELF